jgi:hypothetical protein
MAIDDDFDENALYDQFPRGDVTENGPEEGFNTFVRINDAGLFTAAALEDPTIRAFVDAPISVTFARFKSSHRESEYFIHKPLQAMTGGVEGIEGKVDRFPTDNPRIPTLVINHERTLAKKITLSLTLADGVTAGQIIYKEVPA